MEQALTLQAFETCPFVLDENGRILHCPADAADRIHSPERFLEGRRLRDLLLAMNESWGERLPGDLADLQDSVFLPWRDSTGEDSAGGFQLHVLPAGEQLHVSLVPTLAPLQELAENSVQDLPSQPAALAQLFLRLRQSETRLAHYMEHFPGIFFSQRADLSFSYIGPGLEELSGVDSNLLCRSGNAFLDLIAESDRESFIADIERNAQRRETFSFSYRIRHPETGKIHYLMDVRTPRLSSSGFVLGYEGVWLDITRQAVAEKRLSHTAWKESLATVTSGLVHDFSNIMAGIFSLSELYCSSLEKDHAWYRGMTQIMNNSREARKLVRRIIDLNREAAGAPNYHDLENLLREQTDLIRIILPKSTELQTHLTEEELPVYLDDVSFRQFILNLAMNSRDALGAEGRISVTTRRVPAGGEVLAGTIEGAVTVEREGVEIVFEDNGSGIPEEIASKIFDPFFTTKESTKGSGFGLYNARLFISQCQGRLSVRSVVGEGTAFHVYLPLADFTEAFDEEEEERRLFAERPRLALYAGLDPSNFELVNRMREREWEICTFSEPELLNRYIESSPYVPHAIVVIYLGMDAYAERLLTEMRENYPKMKRILVIIGRNPDELTPQTRNKVDLILDDSLMNDAIVRKIEALL